MDSILRLWDSKWPLGVFFFHWPTWVWKTEIVKALADTMFWDPNGFIKINCENFSDRYSGSNLFWAPKWYIWYDDKTPFTNKNVTLAYDVAKQTKNLHPMLANLPWFNILLFDEIEKAHPEVIQQLLGLLDEWKITTSNWEVVNFQNSIIVFTSNLWQDKISDAKSKKSIWFWTSWVEKIDIEKIFKSSLKEKFKPEFIWRIHAFVEFEELSKEDCIEIIDIQVKKFNEYLLRYFTESHIQFELSPDVYEYILQTWYSNEKWARELVCTYNNLIKRYFTRLLHSSWFKKYYDYQGNVLVGIDLDMNKNIVFEIILDGQNISESDVKLLEYKEEKPSLSLDRLNEIYATMSAYIELTYINIDGDIDLRDELKIYTNKLKQFWLSQIDISSLKQRAFIEWLRDLVFLEDFEWIWLWTDNKDLFFPYEPRTILKIVERKIESVYNRGHIPRRKFIQNSVKAIMETITQILNISELSGSQENQLLIYIRKVFVEKYGIHNDY